MRELYRKILKGHKDVRFYNNPFYPEPVRVRALFSIELDEIEEKCLSECDPEIGEFIINVKILQSLGNVDVSDKLEGLNLGELAKYFALIDYYVCYYGTESREFGISFNKFCKNVRGVHDMADYILDISTADVAQIAEFYLTEEGQEIARLIYNFNMPLVKEMHKLTMVQRAYLTLLPSTRSDAVPITGYEDEMEKEIVQTPEQFLNKWKAMVKPKQKDPLKYKRKIEIPDFLKPMIGERNKIYNKEDEDANPEGS